MTYGDFVTTVLEHLSVDAERRGLEDFRAQMIRNAVINLQRFIPSYQQNHTTTYHEADLQAEEYGAIGNLPEGAIPSAFYIVSTEVDSEDVAHPYCNRDRMDYWPWEQRQHLLCTQCERRLYAYSLSPDRKMFVIHPALNDETYLLLVWNGLKRDFENADEVPWPEEAAEPVAAYVKWRILLEIDKNPALAREQLAIWQNGRLALYRDQNDKGDAEKPDQEYPASLAPNPPAANF